LSCENFPRPNENLVWGTADPHASENEKMGSSGSRMHELFCNRGAWHADRKAGKGRARRERLRPLISSERAKKTYDVNDISKSAAMVKVRRIVGRMVSANGSVSRRAFRRAPIQFENESRRFWISGIASSSEQASNVCHAVLKGAAI
jgi:hypothetical protein